MGNFPWNLDVLILTSYLSRGTNTLNPGTEWTPPTLWVCISSSLCLSVERRGLEHMEASIPDLCALVTKVVRFTACQRLSSHVAIVTRRNIQRFLRTVIYLRAVKSFLRYQKQQKFQQDDNSKYYFHFITFCNWKSNPESDFLLAQSGFILRIHLFQGENESRRCRLRNFLRLF